MDSVTQIALGAAVSEAVVGKKSGRKAAVWGAILGTFPDLDVFLPMSDPVSSFVYHRSFSHSFFVLAICVPIWLWLIMKIHPAERPRQKKWLLAVFLIFYTHVILDAFTVYGTQLFWPLTNHPVSIGSVFIVDPVYTLALLLGVGLFLANRGRFGFRANLTGLLLSSFYLLWSLAAQAFVKDHAVDSLQKEQITFSQVLATPTPINTLLWRLVAISEDGYYVGYYSFFDQSENMSFKFVSSRYDMLPALRKHPRVDKLADFTHGFFAIDEKQNKWVFSDVRMGIEPSYVFQFIVAEGDPPNFVKPMRYSAERNIERLKKVFPRILDESIQL